MRTFDPIKGEFVENSGPAAELPVLRRTPSWFEIMLNQARARRDAMAQQAMEAFESGGIQGALGHAYAMTRPDPNPNAAAIFAALGGGAVAATSPFPFGRGGPPAGQARRSRRPVVRRLVPKKEAVEIQVNMNPGQSRKWQSRLTVNGRGIYRSGWFSSEEDAKAMASKVAGEWESQARLANKTLSEYISEILGD